MSDNTTLVVVGCGSAKRDVQSKAKDLYTSAYFSVKRNYGETIGDDWRVFSAKYGIVDPNAIIFPYDQSITDCTSEEVETLAEHCRTGLSLWASKNQESTIEAWSESGSNKLDCEIQLLLGRRYLEPLREQNAFDVWFDGIEITTPLQDAGCSGMGEQMSWMNGKIESYQNSGVIHE